MVSMMTFDTKDEWKERRRNYIGGSDASSIVGMNPYKTNTDLWEIKTGRADAEDISDKPCVKYGTVAEEHLRALFGLDFPRYELFYVDNNMWLNDKYPFAHASLDGWLVDEDGRKGILEIKTTSILQSMQKEKWNNRIPDNYYIQVLHYLMVTEFDFAVLVAQIKSDFGGNVYKQTKHYMIERADDVEEDIEYLKNEERKFWCYVEKGIKPPLRLPEI